MTYYSPCVVAGPAPIMGAAWVGEVFHQYAVQSLEEPCYRQAVRTPGFLLMGALA